MMVAAARAHFRFSGGWRFANIGMSPAADPIRGRFSLVRVFVLQIPSDSSGSSGTPHGPAPLPAPDAIRRAGRAGVAVALWARLPLRLARFLGGLAGCATYLLSPRYRRKIRENLGQAGLDARALRWRVAAHTGQTLAELPYVWVRPAELLNQCVVTEGFDLIARAQTRGEGILFLTPHLGAFDLAARFFAGQAPITVMFKPPPTPALARVLEASRNTGQMRAVPASVAGVRAMLRSLREGEAVGLLPDQVPTAGQGEWSPFFGRPAFTMTLPARLARSGPVCVLLAVAQRRAGGWLLRIEAMQAAPYPDALNAAMERLIRSCPEQYLWGYSRYRRPPGVDPPLEGLPAPRFSGAGSAVKGDLEGGAR
jgi:KDO2-lipid IV(A) lauroyltransferase